MPTLGKLWPEDRKFKARLDNIVRCCLKNQINQTGSGCSSMAECLCHMHKDPVSVPSTIKTKVKISTLYHF